jgi:hypoxanthine phosphoribosyltransferase
VQALLRAGLRTARSPLRAAESVLSALAELDERIGEIFLGADEIRGRVREIGAELARTYEGSEPLLVGSLKSCIPFVCDLSRAIQIHHHLDFIELAGYGEDDDGIRFLKDLNAEIEGRDVVLVDAVIDTGLTMHYLVRSMTIRSPRSLRIASLFDRPYRRLVDDLPVGWVGFTIPDEFFVGYGFELDERYRNLPDLRLVL